MRITARNGKIDGLYFDDGENEGDEDLIGEAKRQLEEYFAGTRKAFDLPLEISGTEFQKKVYAELLKIPYGETISYKELALRVGNEKAARAAGGAVGKNPISIIVPCHRVVGSDGSLTGFGGGLPTKLKLLELERANCKKT
jgi:methylated-DNA-[protein]-cysteine S-methyltransferase